jgi:hypothetical protein
LTSSFALPSGGVKNQMNNTNSQDSGEEQLWNNRRIGLRLKYRLEWKKMDKVRSSSYLGWLNSSIQPLQPREEHHSLDK